MMVPWGEQAHLPISVVNLLGVADHLQGNQVPSGTGTLDQALYKAMCGMGVCS